MDYTSYKTQSARQQHIQRDWILIDADSQVLGRLASRVAQVIRGKHKPHFTPHVDCGDNVVIINAAKVHLTGNKRDKKQYITHTGYPGGQKVTTPRQLQEKFPERVVEHAVKGMLPKNRLGRQLFHHLFVYRGQEHKHTAQKPREIFLKDQSI